MEVGFVLTLPSRCLLLLFLTALSAVSLPSDVHISPFGNDDSGTGTREYPYQTLAKAVSSVSSGGTVYFESGAYSNTNFITINQPIQLQGVGFVSLSCNGDPDRNFRFNANTSITGIHFLNCPSGFSPTIQFQQNLIINNSSFRNMGGIDFLSCDTPYSSISIRNSTFLDNSGSISLSCPSTFEEITFRNSSSLQTSSTIRISNSLFESCRNSGVLSLTQGANAFINQTWFDLNYNAKNGGAILSDHSTLTILNSTFRTNYGENGGAIQASNSSLHLIDCALDYNSASGSGGGVYLSSRSILNAEWTYFSKNRASRDGGGLACDSSDNVVSLVGCDFFENQPLVTNCQFY